MQKNSIFCFIFFISFICVAFSLQAQQAVKGADRPVRVEIPVKSTDETYRIVPVDETGMLLYFRSIETLNDSLTKWYFSLYDKNLNPVWVKSVGVRTGLESVDSYLENGTLTLLFLPGEKAKGVNGVEVIVRLDCKSGVFTGSRYKLGGNTVPVKFMVFRNQAFLGYNLKNEASHIQVIDLESGKDTDHLITARGTVSYLTGFIIDTLSGTLYATIRKPVAKNHLMCSLLKMNFTSGSVTETEISTISTSWELGNLQLLLTNPDELLLVSTYSAFGRSGKRGAASGSSGFFTCRFRNGVQTDIRFKNFLDLKNFQNAIGEKDLISIKKKAMKKNRSLDNYSAELSLLVHPLWVHNNQVIFMGESYIPEYHPENFTEFDFYGRPYVNTYNVFDGYRYTSAIIAGFDKTGNLIWDNSMEIRNLISPELSPRVNVYCSSSDTMVLCYSSEARIASKIIKEGVVLEKLDFAAIDQMLPEDKMLTEGKNYMVPWYGSYFLCYGYQEIKNINSTENKKRLVYYFTKVKFD